MHSTVVDCPARRLSAPSTQLLSKGGIDRSCQFGYHRSMLWAPLDSARWIMSIMIIMTKWCGVRYRGNRATSMDHFVQPKSQSQQKLQWHESELLLNSVINCQNINRRRVIYWDICFVSNMFHNKPNNEFYILGHSPNRWATQFVFESQSTLSHSWIWFHSIVCHCVRPISKRQETNKQHKLKPKLQGK